MRKDIDMDKDIINIDGAIKSQLKKDNLFTVAVLQRCRKLVSRLMEYCNTVKLTLGDWSGDGHGSCNEYIYAVNYPVERLRQAYKDSCSKLNIQFHRTTSSSCEQIWVEYGDSSMPAKTADVLKQNNIITQDMLDNADYEYENEGIPLKYYFDIDTTADIIMRFIAYSMPGDFSHKPVHPPSTEPINGCYNGELDEQFGYGLFD